MANAPEPSAARRNVGFEHCSGRVAAHQIGMADNARAGPGRTIDTAGADGGKAVDELGLTDWPHF